MPSTASRCVVNSIALMHTSSLTIMPVTSMLCVNQRQRTVMPMGSEKGASKDHGKSNLNARAQLRRAACRSPPFFVLAGSPAPQVCFRVSECSSKCSSAPENCAASIPRGLTCEHDYPDHSYTCHAGSSAPFLRADLPVLVLVLQGASGVAAIRILS
jgi:hypothetical protein